jgi:RsiW-degrading membrane proteinase PrsW (M82 family)
MFLIHLVGALLPVVLILLYVYKKDRFPEPPGVVLRTFLLGVAVALPISIVEFVVDGAGSLAGIERGSLVHAGYTAFAVAALVEELGKFAVLWFYAARHDAFDEPMDGVVYGCAASLGFACIENILYVFAGSTEMSGTAIAVARAFTAVPGHAAFGVLMGACIGIGKFAGHRQGQWIALGLAGAVGLHGMYDFGLFAANSLAGSETSWAAVFPMLLTIGTLIAMLAASALALARMRRDQRLMVAAAGEGIPEETPLRAEYHEETAYEPSDDELESRRRLLAEAPTPRLPMVSIVCSATSIGFWVLAIFIVLLVALAGKEAEDAPVAVAAFGLLLVLAVMAGAAGSVVGIMALSMERRWKPVSITGLVIGTLVAGGTCLLFVVGALAA